MASPPLDLLDRARVVLQRCDELAACSEETDAITRPYGTAALRHAQSLVAGWMEQAAMRTRRDAVGNLVGRYEAADPVAATLLLGSHLDSVRDAGRYDGPLGVLLAVAAIERLARSGRRLPVAVEVVAFADEEGLRFHTAYLGSRAFAGRFDPGLLTRSDADGISLADAVRAFGGDPDVLRSAPPVDRPLAGYVEVHIEQGPALESLGVPLGVVSAIASQTRAAVAFEGEAGHAGTVAMPLRRDALSGAAEFVLRVEEVAWERPGLVATVGALAVEPGASNVIPARATLSLDVRHAADREREAARDLLRDLGREIAARRGLGFDWRIVQENSAVACDPALSDRLAAAVAAASYPIHRLPSGAGHDGVVLAAICPIAMLFVRCAGGVSHHPAEAVAEEDVAAALTTLDRFLEAAVEERLLSTAWPA